MSGGWKIVKAMGTKITKVTPFEGVAAENSRCSYIICYWSNAHSSEYYTYDNRLDYGRRGYQTTVGSALGALRSI